MTDDARAKEVIGSCDRLIGDRSVLDSHLQEIKDFIRPLAQSFTGTDVMGAKSRHEILDNSAESVAETLYSFMHGELTNPAEKWAQLEAEDEQLNSRGHIAAWLEDTETRAYRQLYGRRSKWGGELISWFGEYVDFGTAVMEILRGDGRGFQYKTYPLAESYLDQDAEGTVDTLHRRFKLTARQAVAKWGEDAGPKTVVKANDPKTAGDKSEFLRAVFPRDRRDQVGRGFASLWINVSEQHVIREGAYFEFPFMVGRWALRGDEAYGRGPGMRALADVKMLQRAMSSTIRGVEKTIEPPLMAPDDGVVGPISLEDAAITYYRSDLIHGRRPPIEPLLSGARPDVGEEFMVGVRSRIANAYYDHLLRLPREPRMPVAHVLKLAEERVRVLGPIFERAQTEAIGPAFDRIVQIMMRDKLTLPPPPELQGAEIKVAFANPFAQARAVSESAAIAQHLELNLPLIDRDPTILDNLDGDEAFRKSGAGLKVPMTIMRDPDAVKAIRADRQEREQEREQSEIMANQAKAAQSASQAVQGLGGGAR